MSCQSPLARVCYFNVYYYSFLISSLFGLHKIVVFLSHSLAIHNTTMSKDSLSLAQKVAIITGSGRETGIGAAIASTLARNGAWVVINHVSDASGPRAAAVAQSIVDAGGNAVVVQADVSTPGGAKGLVQQTLETFGVDHIDILGNTSRYLLSYFLIGADA
jgi:hypothetical protein